MSKKGRNFIKKSPSKLLIGLLALVGVMQIFLANSLSARGREISRLESLKIDLQKENELLSQRSSSLASLENIRLLAKQKLNMVDGLSSFDYFDTRVALR